MGTRSLCRARDWVHGLGSSTLYTLGIVTQFCCRHEVVGVVKEVGKNVTKFKPGDRVGVGYYVMSCRSCDLCEARQENYCAESIRQFNHVDVDKTITRGGFSNLQVTNERYYQHLPNRFICYCSLTFIGFRGMAKLWVSLPLQGMHINFPCIIKESSLSDNLTNPHFVQVCGAHSRCVVYGKRSATSVCRDHSV